jgi:uncharacterized protein with HEPN domain
MPSDAERAVLYDILHNLDLVQQFIQDRDYERFRVDTLRVYAVTRCLEIISEASRRLSEGLKARHPDIAWHEMAGAGNVYRHDYEDVSVQRLWDTVQLALPPLRAVVMAEIGGLPPEDA